MSERGSFTTEYVYCGRCFELLREALLGHDSSLCSVQIPSWEGPDERLPIIAGKIASTYPGGEVLEVELRMSLVTSKLCHAVRVAVLAEDGGGVLVFGSGEFDGPWVEPP